MRKTLLILTVVFLAAAIAAGCAGKKAASSNEAIEVSRTIQNQEQKVDYLIGQAKAFYSSKEYEQSVDLAQYVLSKLDANSQEAKNILEKAKKGLVDLGKKKADELKSRMGNLGN